MTTWEYLMLVRWEQGDRNQEFYVRPLGKLDWRLVFEPKPGSKPGSSEIEFKLGEVSKGRISKGRVSVINLSVKGKPLASWELGPTRYGVGSSAYLVSGWLGCGDYFWDATVELLCCEGWEPFAIDSWAYGRMLNFKRSR